MARSRDSRTGRPAEPVRETRSVYPESVDRLIGELARLPGIGRRTAERLAFHLLRADKPQAMRLAEAISAVKTAVRYCDVCYNFAERARCAVCESPSRDRGLVLVVEQPKDLIALEQVGTYRGVYHVLLGNISPLDGVGPGDLTISRLLERIDNPGSNSGGERVREVILGLNPTLEGDGTGLYLAGEIHRRGVAVSRLARGLPAGRELEFANKLVLADAIEGRQAVR
ncbi:MAG: recombination protein RecR [Phycisphaerales bacterium]|nr:recombination protein RecR [Phycisphaerales bacterium]